jgi:hypothetical protein
MSRGVPVVGRLGRISAGALRTKRPAHPRPSRGARRRRTGFLTILEGEVPAEGFIASIVAANDHQPAAEARVRALQWQLWEASTAVNETVRRRERLRAAPGLASATLALRLEVWVRPRARGEAANSVRKRPPGESPPSQTAPQTPQAPVRALLRPTGCFRTCLRHQPREPSMGDHPVAARAGRVEPAPRRKRSPSILVTEGISARQHAPLAFNLSADTAPE